MTNQNDNKDEDGGTDWTIPALSAPIAGVADYYFKPFGGAFESAGLFASISAGISALWGPLHGGANQAVLEMLEAIAADDGDTKKYMGKAKDKDDPFRLMGFGHRVYKNFDPRARIIKKSGRRGY